MHVLAALGEAPTAAIAVIAILLGLFVVARGQRGDRGERDERGDEEAAPSLLAVPAAAPGSADAPPQLEAMAVHDIGHGTIRLGGIASPRTDAAADPEAVHEPATPVEHPPEGHVASPDPEPAAVPPQPASPEQPSARSRVPFRGKIRLRRPRGR